MRADEWYRRIEATAVLPPETADSFLDDGFVIMPGPIPTGGLRRLSEAYDRAVATADAADVRVSTSTRVNDFVNRGPEFDGIYIYEPLLAACRSIIGGPFKLSGMRGRTLEPGAPRGTLHVDVEHRADGWPLVGFILMVDAFDAENGATRFVPGTHRQPLAPRDVLEDTTASHESQVLACGPAGSMIVFNASVWHGHTANRTDLRRRSVQGHFVPREARASTDHAARVRPETLRRIGGFARYLLDLPSV